MLYVLQVLISSNQESHTFRCFLLVDKVPARLWNMFVRLEKTEDMYKKSNLSGTITEAEQPEECRLVLKVGL